jgi:hypothetical protein
VLTITNAAETKGLKCLPKHVGTQDNTFLVTHTLTVQRTDRGAIELLYIHHHHHHHKPINAPTAWAQALIILNTHTKSKHLHSRLSSPK